MSTLVQAAWAILLGRNSGEQDIVFGSTRACRRSTIPNSEEVVGLFINTVPVRVRLPGDSQVLAWLRNLREQQTAVREFEHTPLVDIQKWSEVPSGSPLFNSLVVFTPRLVGSELHDQGGAWLNREIQFNERTSFPLTLFAYHERELLLKLSYDQSRFTDTRIGACLRQLATVLEALAAGSHLTLAELPSLAVEDRQRLLVDWNKTERNFSDRCIHELIEDQVARTPEATAVVFGTSRSPIAS